MLLICRLRLFICAGNDKARRLVTIGKGSVHINFTEIYPSANLLSESYQTRRYTNFCQFWSVVFVAAIQDSEQRFYINNGDAIQAAHSQGYRIAGTVFFYVARPNGMESFFALGPTDDELTVTVQLLRSFQFVPLVNVDCLLVFRYCFAIKSQSTWPTHSTNRTERMSGM